LLVPLAALVTASFWPRGLARRHCYVSVVPSAEVTGQSGGYDDRTDRLAEILVPAHAADLTHSHAAEGAIAALLDALPAESTRR
jgi:hypothetical protein